MQCHTVRIMVSRHSAFYSPLIATIAAGFLEAEGYDATYEVLQPGQKSARLISEGVVDIMQSAVSSNWAPMEKGETDLPVHFAIINRRDGFFVTGREPDTSFQWKTLEGKRLLADHASQPLFMLKYAAWRNAVDWTRIEVIDAGAPEDMEKAFPAGQGDYVHLQGPAPQQLERDGSGFVVASVGDAMPAVAFSTLCASREFLERTPAQHFLRAYGKARQWVRQAPPADVAAKEARFFPAYEPAALEAAIARYQALGCWSGELAIPRDLYEQSLEVFLHSGAITRRHPYEAVVAAITAAPR